MLNNFLTTTFNQISTNWLSLRRNASAANAKTANPQRPRLMCVLAHPDDEALTVGGTLAKYAAQGVEISLVVATRGERGWRGSPETDPGLHRVGQLRDAELRAAACELGVRTVQFLDYVDGQVDAVPFDELVGKIAQTVYKFRPDVVVTFDPHGMYGHPDHIAISQATTHAVMLAADGQGSSAPHRVSKLYYRVYADAALEAYQGVFGALKMQVGGAERGATGWREWNITTRVDVRARVDAVWRAIACHRSQMLIDDSLQDRFRAVHAGALGSETYYRVFSRVNGGPAPETDLFEGLSVKLPSLTGCRITPLFPSRRIVHNGRHL